MLTLWMVHAEGAVKGLYVGGGGRSCEEVVEFRLQANLCDLCCYVLTLLCNASSSKSRVCLCVPLSVSQFACLSACLQCLIVRLSVFLSVRPSVFLPVFLFVFWSVFLPVCLFIALSVRLSVCLSLSLLLCVSISLYVRLPVSISVSLSPCLPICCCVFLPVSLSVLPFLCLPVCLFVFLSLHLPVSLSARLSIYFYRLTVCLFVSLSLPSLCLSAYLLVCSLGSLSSIDLYLVTTTALKGMCNNLIKNICCCCCSCFCCCCLLLLLPFTLQNVSGALSSSSGRTLCSNCHRAREPLSSPRLPSSPLSRLPALIS